MATRLVIFVWCLVVLTDTAHARMGGSRYALERWMERLPHANLKLVPDTEHAGLLYAGRIGSLQTILRVYLQDELIEREQLEVELPAAWRDEFALAIMVKFFQEFVGYKKGEQEIWRIVRAMRNNIIRTGRAESHIEYLGAAFSLQLRSPVNDSSINLEEPLWGTLFWQGEATRLPRLGR
ncbi:MAG: hypothetical protein HY692_06620 [Cyanobacteria bacterium NC_groundwater_1444_Ag_S-0.65um_54_12]|nr:hypothetical protein [Cyanobacteria bacterium NC_groundwater_1444_Ag_S-0.65um_54_12]